MLNESEVYKLEYWVISFHCQNNFKVVLIVKMFTLRPLKTIWTSYTPTTCFICCLTALVMQPDWLYLLNGCPDQNTFVYFKGMQIKLLEYRVDKKNENVSIMCTHGWRNLLTQFYISIHTFPTPTLFVWRKLFNQKNKYWSSVKLLKYKSNNKYREGFHIFALFIVSLNWIDILT